MSDASNKSIHERPGPEALGVSEYDLVRHSGENRRARLNSVERTDVWDTLIRTTGDPSPVVAASGNLFGSANVGNIDRTNLQVAGQLAADQTYVILALRCWLYFTGTNRRNNYLRISTQLYFNLIVGDKPAFQCPAWYLPAGGGVWGFDSGTSTFTNGLPTQEAILKLARPVMVPVRQNFNVVLN